jgi:hypothetical protein
MASTCVKSARELLALFPQTPDLGFAYMKAPWWNVTHISKQELYMEEMLFGTNKVAQLCSVLLFYSLSLGIKANTQQNDPVAERAYFVMRRILQNCAPVLRSKAAELLTEGLAAGESFRPGITPHKDQGASLNRAQGDFFDGSASVTGRQYYPQDLDQNYYDTGQASQDTSMYGNHLLEDFPNAERVRKPIHQQLG